MHLFPFQNLGPRLLVHCIVYRYHYWHVALLGVPVLSSHCVEEHLLGRIDPLLVGAVCSRNRWHFSLCAQRDRLAWMRRLLSYSRHVVPGINGIGIAAFFWLWKKVFVWSVVDRALCFLLVLCLVLLLLLLPWWQELFVCAVIDWTLWFLGCHRYA